jgi:hypothetical protein
MSSFFCLDGAALAPSCRPSERQTGRTAIKTFQKLTELKLFTEDAAKAVEENTANLARYCQDNTTTPSDGSWTCFKFTRSSTELWVVRADAQPRA